MTPRARAWSAAGLSGTAALLAAAGGATWYYAHRLTEPPALAWPPPPRDDDRVTVLGLTATGGEVRLRGPDADRTGVWGLTFDGGYARVGAETVPGRDGTVQRPFELLTGSAPAVDTDASLDGHAYPGDPDVLGVPWEDVTYASPVGPCPAWWFPGEGDTAVVFVHGRNARRHEAFRMLSTVVHLGLPALVISYRNDPDAPRSPDGRSHLGATEWEDVEAAVGWLLDRGLRWVVPVGFSMGGACVVNFAHTSPLADRVRGLILEAPVLDWGPVIRAAAVDRGLPASVLPWLLPATMRLASVWTGIDWADMRHDAASFRHPQLLIHGEDDATVPVALADALAEARPDLVTYLRVAGAGHVRSWNADPGTYGSAVAAFLRGLLTA